MEELLRLMVLRPPEEPQNPVTLTLDGATPPVRPDADLLTEADQLAKLRTLVLKGLETPPDETGDDAWTELGARLRSAVRWQWDNDRSHADLVRVVDGLRGYEAVDAIRVELDEEAVRSRAEAFVVVGPAEPPDPPPAPQPIDPEVVDRAREAIDDVARRRADARQALLDLGRVGGSDLRSVRVLDQNRSETRVQLTAAGVRRLSPSTLDTVKTLGFDISTSDVGTVESRLTDTARDAGMALDLVRRGGLARKPIAGGADGPSVLDLLADGADTRVILGTFMPLGTRLIRRTRALAVPRLRPAGYADLVVVEERTIGYEPGDIAHVENVMRSEKRERTHRRRLQTDEFFSVERETEKSEERDLASTDRSQLSTETATTTREERAAAGEVSVTARYGKTLEVAASATLSVTSAREQSVKRAAETAQEIVDRSVTKVSERVREQRTRRVVEEVEETNLHGFDASAMTTQVTGVYQWLDRVSRVRMVSHGLRQMYDLIVPEPAAFLLDGVAAGDAVPEWALQAPPSLTLADDDPTPLTPDEIDPANFPELVARFRASGVPAPPDPTPQTYTAVLGGAPGREDWRDHREQSSARITLTDGYVATHAVVTSSAWGGPDPTETAVSVHVANHPFTFPGFHSGSMQDADLDVAGGEIGVAATAGGSSLYSVVVTVTAMRSERALQAWQITVYEALLAAHSAWQDAYRAEREKLAARTLVDRSAPIGVHPAQLRQVAADEIRRTAISVMLGVPPDADLIAEGPPIGVDEAVRAERAPLVRFIEQAFEWEHVQWVLYPYFWGRAGHWARRLAIEESDPEFSRFLRAGAARVQLPVRPGFEGYVRHFFDSGSPWGDGPPPEVGDEGWVPFVEELRSDRGGGPAGTPYGDPWTVRVPTTLVHLRPEGVPLPRWEQVPPDPEDPEAAEVWVDRGLTPTS